MTAIPPRPPAPRCISASTVHADQPDGAVLTALHRARTAGETAAAWVRGLADRQDDDLHAQALRRTADAIEQASHREVVPGGNGHLAEQLRHALAADVLLGDLTAGTASVLAQGERLPLVAVCAIAAAMPGTVLGDLPRELQMLAADLEDAVRTGDTATEAAGARALTAARPRFVLGSDDNDPFDHQAYQRVLDRGSEAFEIALHYQGAGQPVHARAEALHNALAVMAPAVAAAAILRASFDPALGLDLGQWEHLQEVAGVLDLDVVEDLTGANGDGLPLPHRAEAPR
ncbi:hypothetical protein [Kitasatospora sp. GP82]|uniref:hypothetical protein n=1 Tax=Kitasatospora sp. GP82 TaxID=3035089 RepID=UPI002477262D|nr:hypothetical protein [Kitasatospora sp. GP82]MDH6129926.1 hypothetical protein [Kitasatospora sp. GP82]